MKRFVFSFNLIVVSTRSCSLPMLAPGKDLVFALLKLDLKHFGMQSFCPGQLMGVESFGRGKSVDLCKL